MFGGNHNNIRLVPNFSVYRRLLQATYVRSIARGGESLMAEAGDPSRRNLGLPVLQVARLSPLADKHFNMLGRYHHTVTDSILRGDLRPLRDPDAQKNSFGQPDLSVRFGSNDGGTPATGSNYETLGKTLK